MHEDLWRPRKDGEENLIIHKGKIVDKKKPTLKHFMTEDTKVKLGLQDWQLCSKSGSNEHINNNCKTNKGERKNKCSNIDKISCLYLNTRSVINKRDELELYIIENKLGQIVTSDRPYSELNLEGCELFRNDRDIKNENGNDKKGFGVVIYVKHALNPTDKADFENSSFKECKWVDIHVWNENTLIGVCYRAPLNSEQEDEGLIE